MPGIQPKTENALQAQICSVLNYVQLPYFSIPNGTYKKNIRTRNLYTATGLKSGVPDLFICRSTGVYHGTFIEVKLGSGGRVSDKQKEWHLRLANEGYLVIVIRYLHELYALLRTYYPDNANKVHNINKLIEDKYEF